MARPTRAVLPANRNHSFRLTLEEERLLMKLVELEARRLGPGYNVTTTSLIRRWLWEQARDLGLDEGTTDLPLPSTSVVYFLQTTGPSGVIKIGTSTDVTTRLRWHQGHHPVPLKLVLTVPGGYRQEKAYHLMFAHLRAEGEWFFPEPDLVTFIEQERTKQMAGVDLGPEPLPTSALFTPSPARVVQRAEPEEITGDDLDELLGK